MAILRYRSVFLLQVLAGSIPFPEVVTTYPLGGTQHFRTLRAGVATVSRKWLHLNQEDILGPKQVALTAGVPYSRGMIEFEDRFAA